MDIACNPPVYFKDNPKMRGKNVLIVGGTTGVGEALARRCAKLGANVEVIGLKLNKSLPVPQYIFDVSLNIEMVELMMMGKDYVFNNVGMIDSGKIVDTSRDTVKLFLSVNVETMFMLTKYALKYVKEVVVNMGTKPKFDKYAEMSLYAMTKHSIIDLTLAADEEGEQKFYCICPSRTDTSFRDLVYPNEDKSTRLTPDQVAEHIIYLFNGKNPTGAYWLRKIYENSADSRYV